MAEQFANHPGTTLATAITTTSRPVTVTLASSAGLPSSANFRLLIEQELLLVTAVLGSNSFTASTVEGTAAATHLSGVLVSHILTAGALVQLEADVTAGAAATGLQSANNLSDVASVSVSRGNLGLGSAAVANASALTESTSAVLVITGGSTAILDPASIQVLQASGSQPGYLASADWSTFNDKQSALGFGNVTEATSAILTITGGTGAVIGSGLSIQVKQATTWASGYLSSTDWATFNSKQSALTLGNLTEATSAVLTITGGAGAIIGSGLSIQVAMATASVPGYLSSTDWNTFNGKQSALGFTPLNAASNLSDLASAASARSNLGLGSAAVLTAAAANGAATLNSGGTLTAAQIPASLVGAVVYQGTWDASANAPTLASGSGAKGFYYKVSTAGSTAIDGISSWNLGDTIIFDGTAWDKIDGQAIEVLTVFGRSGAVTAQAGDYTATQIGLGNVANALQLAAANNLSDLASTPAALMNLGLTSAATATPASLTEVTSSVLTISGGSVALLAATTIQVARASTSVSGYLSSTDWNTFNSKQASLGFTPLNAASNLSDVGNAATARTNLGLTSAATTTPASLTEATSSVLTITGGSAALLAATTIQVKQATASVSGYLSNADWNTFNSKQAALSPAALTEATSSVLTITGGASALLAATSIQVKQSSASASGYLSSADWNTFNGKQTALTLGNLTEATSAILTITGGTSAIIGSGLTIQVQKATASVPGYLASADFSTFSGKQTALSITNDTNVTGSLSGGTLTLGFTGTLAASRLNSNVVQSITNDTNITGSITSQALTLGWSGQLSIARGGTSASTASAALTALGGASLTAANTFSGAATFSAGSNFYGGSTFNGLQQFGGTITGVSGSSAIYIGPTMANTGSSNVINIQATVSGTSITTMNNIAANTTLAASATVTTNFVLRGNAPALGAGAGISANYVLGIVGPSSMGAGATIAVSYGICIWPQAATGITTAYGIVQQGASDLNTFAGATTFSNSLKVNSSTTTIALATPGAPTVTPTGTAGSTSYSYTVVALQADGSTTIAGTAGNTTTGNATLSATNYNALSWSAVTNAASYSIYRTASGGSPSSTGKIATAQTATTLSDTGLAASGSSPTSNTTGALTVAGPATLKALNTGVRSVTANDTATNTDRTIILNGSSLTETLPASPGNGQELYLVNLNASSVTVSGNGNNIWAAGTSASTYTLAATTSGIIQFDNVNAIWRVIK